MVAQRFRSFASAARPDRFVVALVLAAVVASLLPARGLALDVLDVLTPVAVGLLFFFYGARLSAAETRAGLGHWRLHALVLSTTFVVFPAAGVLARIVTEPLLGAGLAAGVLLLCLVPSTVQSCVVNTRIAGGNVAAAVVSATLSSLIGVAITPLLVAWLLAGDARIDALAIVRIVAQLLVPFVLGQALRRWIGGWVGRHDRALTTFDRSAIVLVVFVAFSKGTDAGLWRSTTAIDLLVVVVIAASLLALASAWCGATARLLRFPAADRLTILFCGSNKSLAAGLPIATVLFPGRVLAFVVLPLMIYHQLQIITGTLLAKRFSRRSPD